MSSLKVNKEKPFLADSFYLFPFIVYPYCLKILIEGRLQPVYHRMLADNFDVRQMKVKINSFYLDCPT